MLLCAWCSLHLSMNTILSEHVVNDRPALVTRLYSHFASISYHFTSACLKTSRAAHGFIVEVGGRSGSGALSRGTSHQSNLWPTVPLITRLLMALSLGENQSVAKDDGRWSLQPITEWLRTAEGTNQSATQKLKAGVFTRGLHSNIWLPNKQYACCFSNQWDRERASWEHACVRGRDGFML